MRYGKGDRVKVTIEGLLNDVAGEHVRLNGQWLHLPKSARIEVTRRRQDVPFENGAVYVDALGDVYVFNASVKGWLQPGWAQFVRYNAPIRPLRRLTPEGR